MTRIGVVGIGRFGWNHLRAFAQAEAAGAAKLVAAADVSEERLREAARDFDIPTYADHRELLDREDLDAVSIATPDHSHRTIVLDAIAAGKHVFVEKPMDITVGGCREMIDAAKAAGLLLQVDFHKRHDPYHMELHRAVQEGKLGDVLYGYCHIEDRIEVPRDWFPNWAPQSSPLWFLGVHFFDLARWVLQSNAKSVFARGQRRKLTALGVETYDSVQTQVEFQNGAVVTFDSSWVLPDGFEAVVNQGIRLVGTEGVVEVDSQDRGARSCFSDAGMQTYNLGFIQQTTGRGGRSLWRGYGIECIADFAGNIAFLREGGQVADLAPTVATGEDGLEATKIACAAEESLRTGLPVET